MNIILKENDWAKQMIDSRNLGKKPSKTLRRVARYYLDEGFTALEVRKKIEAFLFLCDQTVSIPKWSDALDYAVNKAQKYKAIDIDYIPITDKEINRVDSLNSKQAKRLAFTLLCLAKYWHIVFDSEDYWVNNKDTDIMSMANVNTSLKRQGLLYYTLSQEGMIQFSKKVDNTNVKVCFVEDGNTVMEIKDFRNLGYQYLMYHGEPYFTCTNCGITTKINSKYGRKQKYCKKCAADIAMQQKINATMKY